MRSWSVRSMLTRPQEP
ncbi:hypothetical protein IEO21_10031 [Rhodonia placenta]|uniref:Uncharacterized protein n=1 Tax=Rhodonia placenta TaxID=104341 RepID=A0A8H7NTC9_9APHY|nr:hypothetical protein IEO21_10031 [Postia placenta]